MVEQLQQLMKALEAGQYNAAPGTLVQGSALQIENLSQVMEVVTFQDADLRFQHALGVEDCKSTLYQFDRQLDYGTFGGSAQYEGGIGEEDTSSFVRATVPMSYYSTPRRVTVASNMVNMVGGIKSEDKSAEDAAKKIAGDIEFDLFRGLDDFSNGGIFDGNPAAIAALPNMFGVASQIRMSDSLSNTQDLMFAEYGSDQTVIIPVNGTLTQSFVEDASVRSRMNHGKADGLWLDPVSLSAYNKIAYNMQRIFLGGAPQESTGAHLRTQWTSNQVVAMESSRFLSGKTSPARSRGHVAAPATVTSAAAVDANSNLLAGSYFYKVTACNERGESVATSIAAAQAVVLGEKVTLTIAAVSGAKYFNVYRSVDGGSAAHAKFIGRVIASGTGSTLFVDLGNKLPGSVTGFLFQNDTAKIEQLSAYSRLKLAVSDLSLPEAHFRFLTLAVKQPRKNVLLENIDGQLN